MIGAGDAEMARAKKLFRRPPKDGRENNGRVVNRRRS